MAIVYLPRRERSLLERIALGILAVAVIVLGFFFLAAAVVAGAILAGIILLRFWWLKRKLRKAADREYVKAEYRVVDREQSAVSRRPPQQ
jgi:predicted lipid-binding transport protein (Tim44 family)